MKSKRLSVAQHKQALISIYSQSPDPRHAHVLSRIQKCGAPVYITNKQTGEVREGKHYCKTRVCRLCQLKKQRALIRQSEPIATRLAENFDLRFLWLTISFANVPITLARRTLTSINDGFTQLLHRSSIWPGVGAFTSREFTISGEEEIHFNTHSVLGVQPSYFSSPNFVKQSVWVEEVRRRFKLEYSPNVDIKSLRGIDAASVKQDFLTVFAYSTKPVEFLSRPDVTLELADQLRGSARVTWSGLFKRLKHELSQPEEDA